MPFLIDKIRKQFSGGRRETFKVTKVFERLEEEGFKPLIKNDQLESRRERLRESLTVALDVLNNAETPEQKGLAVDEVYVLLMDIAGPWLRSMDNDWLAHKVNCFIELYREFRQVPEWLDVLVSCAAAMINLSMTNIDVEPLTPIIIQTVYVPHRRIPFGWEEAVYPQETEKQGE